MEEKDLKDMSTLELQELKMDKLYCMNGVIKTCKQLGNKDWKNNVIVKAYGDKILEINKILNDREKKYGKLYLNI